MNKAQLVEQIASTTGLSKSAAARALDAVVEGITDTLKNGESIALIGFGGFAVKERAARIGRNPKTGEEINILATKVPVFKVGKGLKLACN